MAELAYALDLGSSLARGAGSIPVRCTKRKAVQPDCFFAPWNSNLPQVRCTRSFHSRPTSLSLRDISPTRRITCQVHQKKSSPTRTAFFAPWNSNLPQVRCTRPFHSRHTSLSLCDISPIRRITCQVHQIDRKLELFDFK